jgi:hypothetical protein
MMTFFPVIEKPVRTPFVLFGEFRMNLLMLALMTTLLVALYVTPATAGDDKEPSN